MTLRLLLVFLPALCLALLCLLCPLVAGDGEAVCTHVIMLRGRGAPVIGASARLCCTWLCHGQPKQQIAVPGISCRLVSYARAWQTALWAQSITWHSTVP
jgi:hypothetical protein